MKPPVGFGVPGTKTVMKSDFLSTSSLPMETSSCVTNPMQYVGGLGNGTSTTLEYVVVFGFKRAVTASLIEI